MPQQKIIILYSDGKSNEKKLSRYFSDENLCWTYLGPNYINFKRIDSYLREHFRYIEISERLDKISNTIRDKYQQYVDDLNTANKDIFEWWFTPISSRNPSMSGVFQNICYLELIKEILSETSKGKKLVIVAENYSIGHAIEANADALGVEVITIGKNKRSLTCRIASGIWWTGKCLFKAGLNYGYAQLSAIRAEKKPAQRYSGISGKTCMIDVFVYEKNFADNGGFTDRYFPGLEQFLIKNGYNVVYYPTFTETKLNKYNLYCKARANDHVFLIEQDFLTIKDYFKSFRHALKSTTFCVNAPPFRGFDVAKIDDGDFKWDCFETIFKAYLQYYAFLRMSVSLGDKFERIISWHENQLQDKALCKAVHTKFNGCKIVGSHAYVHINNELNVYPLKSELILGYDPNYFVSTGINESSKMSRYIDPKLCFIGTAFRSVSLFDTVSLFQNKSNKNLNGNILILLTYNIQDSIELMMKLGRQIPNIEDKIHIIVRCHPDYDKTVITPYIENETWVKRITYSTSDLVDDFWNAKFVITLGTGAAIESCSLGIPTIIVAKSGTFTQNPFDQSTLNQISNAKICYNYSELYESIQRHINKSLGNKENNSKETTSFFENEFTNKSDDNMRIYITTD